MFSLKIISHKYYITQAVIRLANKLTELLGPRLRIPNPKP